MWYSSITCGDDRGIIPVRVDEYINFWFFEPLSHGSLLTAGGLDATPLNVRLALHYIVVSTNKDELIWSTFIYHGSFAVLLWNKASTSLSFFKRLWSCLTICPLCECLYTYVYRSCRALERASSVLLVYVLYVLEIEKVV